MYSLFFLGRLQTKYKKETKSLDYFLFFKWIFKHFPKNFGISGKSYLFSLSKTSLLNCNYVH